MADSSLAHPDNAQGEFFIDTTCIDCPICRQTAPAIFGDGPGQALVIRQPAGSDERLRTLMALVSCPVGSIGSRSPVDVRPAMEALPELIGGGVYWCGFASRNSYGAQSYLIKRPTGNVLVDSPRFTGPLVKQLERLGGVSMMFLTHRDDVADHEKFRRHFGAERVIHEDEAHGDLRTIEQHLTGEGPWTLASDLEAIATPGHTKGHAVLLYRREFLFTGDHLSGDGKGGLRASRTYNWYSWDKQLESIEKLIDTEFSWVLPGHGYRYHAPPERMGQELADALEKLRR